MDDKLVCLMGILCVLCQTARAEVKEVCRLASPDGQNTVVMSLTDRGRPMYRVERAGHVVVRDSSLGLKCETENFGEAMVLHEVEPVTTHHEAYRLVVGNRLSVDIRRDNHCEQPEVCL